MNRYQLREARNHPNVNAFLRVLREGESSQDDSAFTVCYGGTHFAAPPWDHPRKSIKAGAWTSTAAGAFQFLQRTWDNLVKQYGFEDFSPDCQTEAAIALIAGRKALDDVMAGRFDQAIAKCNKEWASLPGSPYGQPVMTMKQARMVYEAWGGSFAETTKSETQEANVPAPLIPIAIAAAQAFLPRLIEMIPALGAAFGSGSEVQKRNVAAASMVADAVTKTLGEPNLQAAMERMESDPEALTQARDAVTSILPTLVEAGGGGLEGARKAAENQSGDWRKLVFSLPFVGLVAFLPTIWAVVAAAVFRASWLIEMDPQMRGTVIGFVMGTVAGGIVMYIYGASMTKSAPKTGGQS